MRDTKTSEEMGGAGGLTLISPEKTHYDQIYVRKYEPEFVRREKMQGTTEFLQGHLALEKFKGNPD